MYASASTRPAEPPVTLPTDSAGAGAVMGRRANVAPPPESPGATVAPA